MKPTLLLVNSALICYICGQAAQSEHKCVHVRYINRMHYLVIVPSLYSYWTLRLQSLLLEYIERIHDINKDIWTVTVVWGWRYIWSVIQWHVCWSIMDNCTTSYPATTSRWHHFAAYLWFFDVAVASLAVATTKMQKIPTPLIMLLYITMMPYALWLMLILYKCC